MKVINHRRGRVGLCGLVNLTPGINEVDPAIWVKVSDHPATRGLMADGERGGITVAGSHEPSAPPPVKKSEQPAEPKPTAKEPPVVPDLSEYSAKDAILFVRECEDLEILQTWEGQETRKTVLAAIEKQFEALE